MEGRKVHFCNSLEWRLLRGPRRARSSTGWSCHGPPPASKGGRSEPLGWDFELSDLGTLIGGGDSHCLATFLCASSGLESRLERDPSPRRGNRGNAAARLTVLSWPSSPFPAPWFLQSLEPLCLHACRVCCIAPDSPQHTICIWAFRQLGRALHWATGRV